MLEPSKVTVPHTEDLCARASTVAFLAYLAYLKSAFGTLSPELYANFSDKIFKAFFAFLLDNFDDFAPVLGENAHMCKFYEAINTVLLEKVDNEQFLQHFDDFKEKFGSADQRNVLRLVEYFKSTNYYHGLLDLKK